MALFSKRLSIEIEPPLFHSDACETVRKLCLELPGVVESSIPGQTSFRVGQRPFVVIETYRDPNGTPYNCMAFKASFFDHERLMKDMTFFPAPYLGGPGWLGRRLDNPAKPIDWSEMEAVFARSHRQIAGRIAYSTRVARGIEPSLLAPASLQEF